MPADLGARQAGERLALFLGIRQVTCVLSQLEQSERGVTQPATVYGYAFERGMPLRVNQSAKAFFYPYAFLPCAVGLGVKGQEGQPERPGQRARGTAKLAVTRP